MKVINKVRENLFIVFRNLVIILSAWAVIKVPMLLNELKFLEFEFMAVRWVLTVIAIVVFFMDHNENCKG
jgi:hypothetical protein